MPAHCITIDLPSQSVRECMHYTLKTCRILASRQPWFVGKSRDRHNAVLGCVLPSQLQDEASTPERIAHSNVEGCTRTSRERRGLGWGVSCPP